MVKALVRILIFGCFILVSEVSDGATCPETFTRTYSIADSCGNVTSCTQLVVIDDTILGLTAVDLYLSYIKTLVADNKRIRFLLNPYSGALSPAFNHSM